MSSALIYYVCFMYIICTLFEHIRVLLLKTFMLLFHIMPIFAVYLSHYD